MIKVFLKKKYFETNIIEEKCEKWENNFFFIESTAICKQLDPIKSFEYSNFILTSLVFYSWMYLICTWDLKKKIWNALLFLFFSCEINVPWHWKR